MNTEKFNPLKKLYKDREESVTITISGRTGSGKTLLSNLIIKELYKLKVNYQYNCERFSDVIKINGGFE